MKASDAVAITVALVTFLGLIILFVVCTLFPELRGLSKPCGQLGGMPQGVNAR